MLTESAAVIIIFLLFASSQHLAKSLCLDCGITDNLGESINLLII